MGMLIDFEHFLEGQPEAFTMLSVALPRDVGEMWERLTLDQRDDVYQIVIDAIRTSETTTTPGRCRPRAVDND
jgi:hypothetical protein